MSKSSLDRLLTEIGSLAYSDLRLRYQEVFHRPPAPRLSQDLLRRSLAYRIQAEWFGGLPPKTEKLLQSSSSPRALNAYRKLEPRQRRERTRSAASDGAGA